MKTSNDSARQRGRFEFGGPEGTRVVVAGRGEACLFDIGPARTLTSAGRLVDAKARLHDRSLTSDRPGRRFDHAPLSSGRRGAIAHHATNGERSAHKQEALMFARRIVSALDRDRRHNRFRRVVLVAGPSFLGLLRETVKGPLAKMVVSHVPVDLVHRPLAEVTADVEQMLARGEL
ncbi:MAG TPA: host attachment protein [Steroidobacteraceae bacterium]|nr:host attachment protein [Steroidobacteraceae bacterium]